MVGAAGLDSALPALLAATFADVDALARFAAARGEAEGSEAPQPPPQDALAGRVAVAQAATAVPVSQAAAAIAEAVRADVARVGARVGVRESLAALRKCGIAVAATAHVASPYKHRLLELPIGLADVPCAFSCDGAAVPVRGCPHTHTHTHTRTFSPRPLPPPPRPCVVPRWHACVSRSLSPPLVPRCARAVRQMDMLLAVARQLRLPASTLMFVTGYDETFDDAAHAAVSLGMACVRVGHSTARTFSSTSPGSPGVTATDAPDPTAGGGSDEPASGGQQQLAFATVQSFVKGEWGVARLACVCCWCCHPRSTLRVCTALLDFPDCLHPDVLCFGPYPINRNIEVFHATPSTVCLVNLKPIVPGARNRDCVVTPRLPCNLRYHGGPLLRTHARACALC